MILGTRRRLRWGLQLSLGPCLGLLIGLAGAAPAGAEPIRLYLRDPRHITFNSPTACPKGPRVAGDTVVWEEWRDAGLDGGGFEWCVSKRTHDLLAVDNPDIELYRYYAPTGAQGPLFRADGAQAYPDISATAIVWEDWRNIPENPTSTPAHWDVNIWAYLFPDGPFLQLTTQAGEQWRPAADGSLVAWVDASADASRTITWYDLAARQVIPPSHTTATVPEGTLALDAGTRIVAWEDCPGGASGWDIQNARCVEAPEIYAILPGEAERRLTQDTFRQGRPAIAGYAILWTELRETIIDGKLRVDQHLYRHAWGQPANSALRLALPGTDQRGIRLSGQRYVFLACDDGDVYPYPCNDVKDERYNYDLWLGDLASGQPVQLTRNEHVLEADIDGDRVVWTSRNPDLSPHHRLYTALLNHAPLANAGPDQTLDASVVVTLTGSGTDPDGESLTCRWTLGSPTGTQLGTTCTLTRPGQVNTTQTYVLTVTDPGGLQGSDSVQVTWRPATTPNQPPIASAFVTPPESGVGTTVALDGCGSWDFDFGDRITSYTWRLGSATGPILSSSSTTCRINWTGPTTPYAETYYLTVTDMGNLTGTVSVSVNWIPIETPRLTITSPILGGGFAFFNGCPSTPAIRVNWLAVHTVGTTLNATINANARKKNSTKTTQFNGVADEAVQPTCLPLNSTAATWLNGRDLKYIDVTLTAQSSPPGPTPGSSTFRIWVNGNRTSGTIQ